MTDDRNVSMEESSRCPTFRPGVPVTLANGESWHFPRPVLRMDPVLEDDGSVTFGEPTRLFRGEIDAEYEAVIEKIMTGDGSVYFADMLSLAVILLRYNYNLDGRSLQAILPRMIGDEANDAMWAEIGEVVFGRPPKPTDSGSGVS